jgi:hypothetical protein
LTKKVEDYLRLYCKKLEERKEVDNLFPARIASAMHILKQ